MIKPKANQYFTEIAYSVKNKQEFNQKVETLLPKGWKIITTSEKNSSAYQYKAAVFINEKTKEIVFANAGTQLQHIWDIWDNFKLYFGYIPSKFPSIKSLINDTVNTLRTMGENIKDYMISTTGHSAGSISAVFAALELQSRGYKVKSTTTFDSPGSKNLLDYAIKQGLFSSKEIKLNEIDFKTYIVTPNLINTTSKQIVPPRMLLKKPKLEPLIEDNNTKTVGFFGSLKTKIGKAIHSTSKFLGIDKLVDKVHNTLNNHGLDNFVNNVLDNVFTDEQNQLSSIIIKKFDRINMKKHLLEYNPQIAKMAKKIKTTGKEKFYMIEEEMQGKNPIHIMISQKTLNKLFHQLALDKQIVGSQISNFVSANDNISPNIIDLDLNLCLNNVKNDNFKKPIIAENKYDMDVFHIVEEEISSASGIIGACDFS